MTVPTMDLAAQVEAFAAQRATRLTEKDEELRAVVTAALADRLAGVEEWARELAIAAAVLWLETYEAEGGQPEPGNVDMFVERLTARLELTANVPISQRQAQIERVTTWVSVFTLNDATVAAVTSRGDEDLRLRWVTMRDEDVRAIHRPLEGQTITPGGTFDVNGHALHFPGEPVGPPEGWISCRCMAMAVSGGEMSTLTAATTPGGVAVDPEPVEAEDVPPEWDDEMDIEVPWHGILAVEGIPTGDLRRFASQALTFDEFPLSLTWQRASAERHDGAVVVGRITNAWTDPDGLVRGEGMFRVSPEADEVIDMIANGDLRGVSVELDSLAMEYSDADGNPIDLEAAAGDGDVYQHLTAGRVRSATVLPVAAFAESYVALGPWPQEEESVTASCAPCIAAEMDDYAADLAAFAISEAAWDGSAARYDDEQWTRATVVDRGESFATAKERYKLPVREPNGDLSRAGVHAAAGRIDQVDAPPDAIAAGKRKIIAAYKELGEDPPEGLTASAFGITSNPSTHDGPGWVSHPEDTQRLRTYWSEGEGAAKIRWGVPGDFSRCRRQLAKYVPNPSYLAGTCANLHQVALGYWPGQGPHAASASPGASEAGVLAASGEAPEPEVAATSPAPNLADPADLPRAEWFRDPGLPMPSPITIIQDKDTGRYRLVGHAAQFGVCHIGLGLSVGDGGCTTAPHSVTNYAYYRTGAVETDEGLVPTGAITMATGHAGSTLGPAPAAAHYDNTGTVVADVAAGEDEHGIWVAGLLRPNVTAEQRAELLAATLSGDWRWIGGNLEMVATLAVNTPGFPIPRLAVAASGGRQTALFAAGIVPPRTTVGEVDGGAVLVSASEVARELHRLAKADAAREQALAALDATRRSVNSERAAQALSVIASGK
jgi:hypothetical protein